MIKGQLIAIETQAIFPRQNEEVRKQRVSDLDGSVFEKKDVQKRERNLWGERGAGC